MKINMKINMKGVGVINNPAKIPKNSEVNKNKRGLIAEASQVARQVEKDTRNGDLAKGVSKAIFVNYIGPLLDASSLSSLSLTSIESNQNVETVVVFLFVNIIDKNHIVKNAKIQLK